jgi:hypothetical protein
MSAPTQYPLAKKRWYRRSKNYASHSQNIYLFTFLTNPTFFGIIYIMRLILLQKCSYYKNKKGKAIKNYYEINE